MSGSRIETFPNGELGFDCPGCKFTHILPVVTGPGVRWGWNGSMESPTFTPSILARGVEMITEEEHAILMAGGHVEPRPFVCHSFVEEGHIRFLGDCTHQLAGKTVELPPIA